MNPCFRGQEYLLVKCLGILVPTCKEEMPQLLALSRRGIRMGHQLKDARDLGGQFLEELRKPVEANISILPVTLGLKLACMRARNSWSTQATYRSIQARSGYINATPSG